MLLKSKNILKIIKQNCFAMTSNYDKNSLN